MNTVLIRVRIRSTDLGELQMSFDGGLHSVRVGTVGFGSAVSDILSCRR